MSEGYLGNTHTFVIIIAEKRDMRRMLPPIFFYNLYDMNSVVT